MHLKNLPEVIYLADNLRLLKARQKFFDTVLFSVTVQTIANKTSVILDKTELNAIAMTISTTLKEKITSIENCLLTLGVTFDEDPTQ